MKSKVLLLISCLLLTGCQAQAKRSVSAETKESSEQQNPAIQQELDSSSSDEITSSSLPVEQSSVKDSSVKEEGSSSFAKEEPIASTETVESTVSSESIEATTEPSVQAVQQVIQPPATPKKVEENYQFSVVRNQTTEEFIQTIGKDAQQIAWDEGLYASVMIAQAILETGSGNSQLARPPHHNLFGIKGSYQGKQVKFNTQEDKGNGQLYTINSAFRQYPSYKESLEDYAALLKNGLSGNPGFYQATWKEAAATYQEATKALTGKYATDTSYDKKLNALIETYQLTSYDLEPNTAEIPISSIEESRSGEQQSEMTEATEPLEASEETSYGVRVSETKQPVIIITPDAQRPAKQLSGNRIAQ
ncbi:glucosaminidase domain-containing protein [Enterococcus sp. 669A]|uniref:Glucosaminidase domain-containing protein n=1 Tax=Candidatus Enterococcus moelleringii TaxID=2815325 RepID=A0ABS3LAD3_9ENTE|nr:glucosaminidase domain-containing protein [Enterococcus sp. 669A]MBO1305389.1 glucosaminidase domain-containing protein [Enterococcus sp. 669A]